jgi:tetratricopeptide (TPR) repeat protein
MFPESVVNFLFLPLKIRLLLRGTCYVLGMNTMSNGRLATYRFMDSHTCRAFDFRCWLNSRTLVASVMLIGLLSLSQQGNAQGTTGVSNDLVEYYQTTTSATTMDDFSKIIDHCLDVLNDKDRSEFDKKYASQLVSWAANKRGELFSDEASAAVDRKQEDVAQELDKKAGQDFRLALSYDPSRLRARHNLAVTLAMQQKFDEAIRELDQVIRQKPDYPNAYYNRAELYFHMERYEVSFEDYTKALELNPSDNQILSGRAHAAFMKQDYEAALADYAEAARLMPTDADVITDFADALQYVQNWKEAANSYRKALEIDPNHTRALENVAWMMATCPEPKYRNAASAIKAIRRAMEKSGQESAKSWDTLAAAHAAFQNWPTAQSAIEKAIAMASAEDRPDLLKRRDLYAKEKMYIQPATSNVQVSELVRTPIGTGAKSR